MPHTQPVEEARIGLTRNMRLLIINIIPGLLLCLACIASFPGLLHAGQLNVPDPYPTIQDAVNAAAPGDSVIIAEGVYRENITVSKPVTLRSWSNSYQNTVIEAREAGRPVIKIEDTSGVVVAGFTVMGSEAAAIHLGRCSGCTVVSNYVIRNYTGIYLENSTNCLVSLNVVTENNDGITLRLSNGNTLESNRADWNAEKGIFLVSSNDNTLKGNTTNSNYWNGITLYSSHRNNVERNVSLQNTYAIVLSDDSADNELHANRTMRRLYYLLPVVLIYLGLTIYHIEKKFFVWYFADREGT